MGFLSKEVDVKYCLLIIIDALRVDRLGIYNEEFESVSRYLTKLGRKAIIFNNAFTTINATDPSLTSIYTGRYPSSHGLINHGEYVSDEELKSISVLPFLQEILSRSGIKTIAVDWLRRWHKRGFNIYLDPRDPHFQALVTIPRKPKIVKILRPIANFVAQVAMKKRIMPIPYTAKEAFAKVKNVIKEHKHERTFILVHLWDTHTPYNAVSERYEEIRKKYRIKPWDKPLSEALETVNGPWRDRLIEMFSPHATLGDIVARYDSAVTNVDLAIEDFVGFLEGLNLIDETLLIITSDHGESLVEHGIFFDHHGLYEPSIRIPLIIYNPRLTPHKVNSFVQNIDLMPTILDIFGVNANITSIEGKSLLRFILDKEEVQIRKEIFVEESYTERKLAIRTKRYKYIITPDPHRATCRYCGYIHGGSLEELYDLEKDPEENHNIIADNDDVVKDLRKILKYYIRQFELKRRVRKSLNY